MADFKLVPVRNFLNPSDDNNSIRYKIKFAVDVEEVKEVNVNISALGSMICWGDITGVMENAESKRMDDNTMSFTFYDVIDVNKDAELVFEIQNIKFDSIAQRLPQAEISFSLYTLDEPLDDKRCEGDIIYIKTITPVISEFRLEPSIIRNGKSMSLHIACKDINEYSITYEDGTKISQQLPPVENERVTAVISNVKLNGRGGRLYLKAKRGGLIATKNNLRIAEERETANWMNTSSFTENVFRKSDKTDEDGEWLYDRIAVDSDVKDLVLNECDGKLWAFASETGTTGYAALWSSEDGLMWQPYTIGKQEANGISSFIKVTIPEKFIHYPAVHFQGRIYFVCGSKLHINDSSSTLYSWNYKEKDSIPQEIKLPTAMAPRSLHGCVVFPHENIDNIWVIGGVDKNGSGLNDVWRYNGKEWVAVKCPANFPARCRFGATVDYGDDKKARNIWIGGGTSEYKGNVLSDMWQYDGNEWKVLNTVSADKRSYAPLVYTDKWISASSLTFLRVGGTIPSVFVNSFYLDGSTVKAQYQRLVSKKEEILGTQNVITSYSFDTDEGATGGVATMKDKSDNFSLTTVAFNGCLWMLAGIYKSRNKVIMSDLFHSCP